MNSILGLSCILQNYPDVGIDRIGTHVLENFFGNIRYACENYDSWENILSAVSNGQIRNTIFQNYGINVQIKNRINVGGIHFYDINDQNLPFFECTSTSYLCHKVLCKLTNVYPFDPKDNLELLKVQYQYIKKDFLNMISETKENKRALLRPSQISSSHIISRCIGYNRELISRSEQDRIEKALPILEKVDSLSKELHQIIPENEEQQSELKNIDQIFIEIKALNETLKKRCDELIFRSEISSDIIEQVAQIKDEEDIILKDINENIVDCEMQRIAASDLEFDEDIKRFISSGVPNLINELYCSDCDIGSKYPFLFEISSILKNYILNSKEYNFCKYLPEDS